MNRHVILTSGRSGSNHLVAAMNQHSELCNFGEVLGPWTLPARLSSPFLRFGASKASILQTVFTSRSVFAAAQSLSFLARKRKGRPTHFRKRGNIRSIGVKEFFMHLRDPEVLAWFRDCEDLAIIHLRREDLVARALSVLRLDMDGQATSVEGDQFAAEMYVDPTALLAGLDDLAAEVREEQEMLKQLSHHRCLSLVHENDMNSWESTQCTLLRVHDFLGVEPTPAINTGHRSALKGRAIESVKNREEIERTILSSAHAELLERHR